MKNHRTRKRSVEIVDGHKLYDYYAKRSGLVRGTINSAPVILPIYESERDDYDEANDVLFSGIRRALPFFTDERGRQFLTDAFPPVDH